MVWCLVFAASMVAVEFVVIVVVSVVALCCSGACCFVLWFSCL